MHSESNKRTNNAIQMVIAVIWQQHKHQPPHDHVKCSESFGRKSHRLSESDRVHSAKPVQCCHIVATIYARDDSG